MEKVYVNFSQKKNQLELSVVEDIKTQYVPILDTKFSYKANDLNSLNEAIVSAKRLLNQSILKRKLTPVYSFIIDDAIYKNIKFVNYSDTFDLVDNVVNEKAQKDLFIAQKEKNRSQEYYLLNNKVYIYELVVNDIETKHYNVFPMSKVGKQLIVHQSLFTVANDSPLVNVINIFKNNNVVFENVLLKSQCLAANQGNDNLYKLMLYFDWNTIVWNGFFNSNTFAYKLSNIKIDEFNNYFKKNFSFKNDEVMKLYCNAVISNWKQYSQMQNSDLKEVALLNVLQKIVDKLVIKTKEFIDKLEMPIEIVLTGKSSDFIQHRFKVLHPEIAVAIYDEKEENLSNTRSYNLGATLIANQFKSRKEDLINTLNNLPEYKPRNIWSKLFSWLIPSLRSYKKA